MGSVDVNSPSDFRSTVVFANPAAGGGRAAKLWHELQLAQPALKAAHVIFAKDEAEARQLLDAALTPSESTPRVERVLSVGGDGTLHLVVNELLRSGRATDIALGLIPAGTGSDLARFLGLPKRPLDALAHVMRAQPRAVDLLRITAQDGTGSTLVEHAVNTASAGLSGLVCGAVNAQPRRGPDVFLRATLSALWRFGPLPCRVDVEGPGLDPAAGEPWYDGDLLLLAMANGRYFGNGMKIAPDAELDDGLMDVVLVPAIPRWKLPLYLPRLYFGTHLGVPGVRFAKATRVRLQPRIPFPPLEVDGEAVLAGDVEVEVLAGALKLLM